MGTRGHPHLFAKGPSLRPMRIGALPLLYVGFNGALELKTGESADVPAETPSAVTGQASAEFAQ